MTTIYVWSLVLQRVYFIIARLIADLAGRVLAGGERRARMGASLAGSPSMRCSSRPR